MVSSRNTFRGSFLAVSRRLGARRAFAWFVIGTMLAAPGAAFGLSLQRSLPEEQNEHRVELESSTQSVGVLQQHRRKHGGRAIPAVSDEIARIHSGMLAASHCRALDSQGAAPACASWISPLRC